MQSLFPGMDPYLESLELWPSFHHLLADEIMAQLNTKLSEKYDADVEVKTVLEEVGIATTYLVYPDAAVMDVEMQTTGLATPPSTLVALPAEQVKLRTVLVYLTETKELVTAIEILSPDNKRGHGLNRYRQKRERLLHTTVHLVELDLLRGGQHPGWEVADPPPDPDMLLELNEALSYIYTRAAYARRIDYGQPTPPPDLRPAMQAWLAEHRPFAPAS